MATDARGHTIPTGSDFAARKSLTDLSLSIPSMRSCASQSAADLYRTSLPTPPTVNKPCYVWRSDLQALYVHNGTSWLPTGQVVYGRAMAGTTIGSPLIIQGGWAAVTTDVNGNANFLYPTPFPNGLISVVLTGFNYTQAGDRVAVLYSTTVLDKVNFRVYQSNGSTLPNTLCAWSWIAMGW